MKKIKAKFINALFVLTIAATIFSCDRKSEQVNYIPKDANIVAIFDIKSIGIKSMDFKEIFNIKTLKKTFEGANIKGDITQKIKNSGVDLLTSAYFFSRISEEGKGYGALVVALSDAEKFEAFTKELDSATQISSEGEYKFANVPGDSKIIGWNKNTAIFFIEQAEITNSKQKLLSFFNLKKEESLSEAQKSFKDIQSESADISFWVNFENLGKLGSQYNPTAGIINWKETFLSATCNFENGQIIIDSKYHTNKETAEKLSFFKDDLTIDIVNAMPGKSVMGMLGFSLDTKKIYEYLEKEKLIGSAEQGAKMTGLTAKELFEMLSGEIVGTINGIEMKEEQSMDYMTGETKTIQRPTPEFAVVIGVKDKEKSAKLLSKAMEMGLVKKENYYSLRDEVFVVDKGSYLLVTGPESMRKFAMDEKGEKLNSALNKMLTENAISIFIDVSIVPDTLLSTMGEEFKLKVKDSQLESISVTGSNMKDNTATGKVIIAFKQKDQNSLITIAQASEKMMQREAAEKVSF